MSFTIDYLNTEVITGKQYKFAIPKTPEDFIEVNNQKLEILPTDKKNVRAIIINDPDERNGTTTILSKRMKEIVPLRLNLVIMLSSQELGTL